MLADSFHIVVGGSMKASFVLEAKEILYFALSTSRHTATIHCIHSDKISWALSNMDLTNSPWRTIRACYEKGIWILVVDTNIIPISCTTD